MTTSTRPVRGRDRRRFRGHIAGVGSGSGVRVVVGRWHTSPLGAFADAMVARPDGVRVLLAPSQEVADFVVATYTFDEVRIEAIRVDDGPGGRWLVRSPSLVLDVVPGRRTLLGWLLRAVPRRVAEAPWWCSLTDVVARVVLRGVRTRGTAGGDRREYYGATDHHALVGGLGSLGTLDGADLGPLRPVTPPPHFGFSSTPRRPSVTTVVTTVVVPERA